MPDSPMWLWLLGLVSGLFWGLAFGRRWGRRDFDLAFDEGAMAAFERFPAYLRAWLKRRDKAEAAARCAIAKGQDCEAAITDACERLGAPELPRLDELRRRR